MNQSQSRSETAALSTLKLMKLARYYSRADRRPVGGCGVRRVIGRSGNGVARVTSASSAICGEPVARVGSSRCTGLVVPVRSSMRVGLTVHVASSRATPGAMARSLMVSVVLAAIMLLAPPAAAAASVSSPAATVVHGSHSVATSLGAPAVSGMDVKELARSQAYAHVRAGSQVHTQMQLRIQARANVHHVAETSLPLPVFQNDTLTQTVDESEQVVRGEPVSIGVGHIDLGPKMVDGKWELLIRDDTVQPAVWRDPSDVVIRVADASKMTAPTGEKYEFLPTQAGQEVYVVPQVQAPNVVWIGWNTQDPKIATTLDRGANLRLLGMEGAGELTLFVQDGAFGEPLPMWDSRVSEPQDVWMEANTHVHANWVFTQPGVYAAAIEVRGKDRDQVEYSAAATLRFAVGDSVSDDDARRGSEPAVTQSAAQQGSAQDGSGSGGAGDVSAGDGAENAARDGEGAHVSGALAGVPRFVISPVGLVLCCGLVVVVCSAVIGCAVRAKKRSARMRDEALKKARARETASEDGGRDDGHSAHHASLPEREQSRDRELSREDISLPAVGELWEEAPSSSTQMRPALHGSQRGISDDN
ncbi:MAG: choice-of-anchor M domain-containing protein [Arcanobacterium sp.]|nr:choice-of-anchor M domain-containing protein [Arcanobacterium sp.]